MIEGTKIRVAIVGGGLAGASLMFGLLQNPNLDVHIFESAAAFKEQGQAIGISENGANALRALGCFECLQKAGAVQQGNSIMNVAEGPDANKVVGEVKVREGVRTVHRAQFLQQLLKDVPPERMHVSKKLQTVETAGSDPSTEHLILHFEDGSTHECDILIGADGIRSKVRQLILPDGDPAAVPRFGGWYTLWGLQDYQKTRSLLGNIIDVDKPFQHGWIGKGTFAMHDITSGGTQVQCVLAFHVDENDKTWDTKSWLQNVPRKFIDDKYSAWPNKIGTGLAELMYDGKDEAPAFAQYEHAKACTYFKGHMCVMGDAAHATTPWQGSGGGMAMEDAVVLSALLGRLKSTKDVPAALQAYDAVRRPRTQRIVESSRGTGMMATGVDPETGLSRDKLVEKMLPRWEHIFDISLDQHVADALTRAGLSKDDH